MATAPRILVTGASGFVGQHAVKALVESGADVHGVGRSARHALCPWVQADILAPGVVADVVAAVQPEIVLHLAWCAEPTSFWGDPINLDWAGVTFGLAKACVANRVRRMIGVGTCFEYDWPENSPCIEGETSLAGHTLYDRAKGASRDLISAYLIQSGLSFAWARLFFLYGPQEAPERLVASVARSLVAGRPALCSSGKAVRDFMDVRDAGAALAKLAVSDVDGDINIASGIPIRVCDIIRSLGALACAPHLIRLGALADRVEPPHIVGANGRLSSDVGFKARFSLSEGLGNALDFWRGNAVHATAGTAI